ncbi:LAME_0H02278g1_1 [Lachancea meyersii CBS 8951]|uniref:LAME_0H02278g1_1 n=1 Tax=Lachancea meyersii CBS 8951 TaxID=1266667 RepID=A0A1G4KDB4_9SACH|nr:LAME_0H02278g1_1 [Lachancea meyersii CBS 8951]
MNRWSKLLSKLGCQLYSTRASKRAQSRHDPVKIKANLSKSRNLLINALERQLNLGKVPAGDSQLGKTLDSVMRETLSDTSLTLQQMRRLFQLILQGKVSASTIDAAWKTSHPKREDMINIKEPQARVKSKKSVVEGRSELLEIHPSTSKEFHRTLNDLGPEITIPPNDESDVKQASNCPAHNGDIDLSSLQTFLETTEKSKREQHQFAQEQTRKYQWNASAGTLGALSPGMLIFNDNRYRKRPTLSKLLFWKGLDSQLPNSRGNQDHISSSAQLLLYDLKKGTRVLTSWKAQMTNLHIEYKDLFTVINGSSKPPEHLLEVITDLEREKWQLIGDAAVNGDSNLVFKRDRKDSKSGKAFSRATNIGLIVLLLGFTTYGVQLRRQRLQRVETHFCA